MRYVLAFGSAAFVLAVVVERVRGARGGDGAAGELAGVGRSRRRPARADACKPPARSLSLSPFRTGPARGFVPMTLPVVLFALVAALTAGSALGVVSRRSVVRAAVWLLFTPDRREPDLLPARGRVPRGGAAHRLRRRDAGAGRVRRDADQPGAVRRPADPAGRVGRRRAGRGGAVRAARGDLARPRSADRRADQPLPGVGPLGLAFLGVPEQPGETGAGVPAAVRDRLGAPARRADCGRVSGPGEAEDGVPFPAQPGVK